MTYGGEAVLETTGNGNEVYVFGTVELLFNHSTI